MSVQGATEAARTLSQRLCEAGTTSIRIFGWSTLTFLAAFLIENFLVFWLGWPGVFAIAAVALDIRAWLLITIYAAAIMVAVLYVHKTRGRPLLAESQRVANINSFLIRAAFWTVLLVGLVDVSLSFLRGESLITDLVGEPLSRNLFRTDFRGPYVHLPMVFASLVIAAVTRKIAVTWLALLVVIAELMLVMFRFVFSFEQVYMSDLVRFWYAALFLFGSAYTLRNEGHVRIDIFYAAFTAKTKGLVNAFGTVLLGMPFCWVILVVGTTGRTGIINSALLTFEIEGLGDGMFVLYLMTVFMGIFAILMLVEFVSFLFRAIADFVGEREVR